MGEIWKQFNDTYYMVSNQGKVKSLPRKTTRGGILKPDNNKGYLRVTLSINGKKKHYFVHDLVAKCFIPNPDNLPQVNHKDENPLNNNVDNLEWCTIEYNLLYGNRRQKVIEKERKPVNQYTPDGILIKEHYSINDAARSLGKNASAICMCCKGKQKSAYGYNWSYAKKKGGG